MLAFHVPTSMGNMVFTPFAIHVGMSESIMPSQSSEHMSRPCRRVRSVMRRYHGPIFASNTAGFTSGPLLKQMSSQKWA